MSRLALCVVVTMCDGSSISSSHLQATGAVAFTTVIPSTAIAKDEPWAALVETRTGREISRFILIASCYSREAFRKVVSLVQGLGSLSY